MLRPKPMARALVVGPRPLLEPTVELLHGMRIVHIVDFTAQDETFRIGRPLPRAAEISDSLVKLRAIASALRLGKVAGLERVELGADVRERILTLEANIAEEEASRKKAEALLADLGQRIEAARPFADLGLALDLYRGYRSLAVFTGRIPGELEGLEAVAPHLEVFRAGDAVAIFVAAAEADAVRDFLGRRGFAPLEPPAGEGDPRALLQGLEGERAKWEERLVEINRRLDILRERYAGFLLAAEDHFATEIEKAEAPLRFATTDHSFIIDGWVPLDAARAMEERISALGPIHVEFHPQGEGPGAKGEEPPVLLDNPKPVRPFELFLNLYSTPSYHEVDPTLILALIFPLFFGLMIGDAGYGLAWIGLGSLGLRKLARGSDLWRVTFAITLGGLFSLAFGLLLYGEMFGIPFHDPATHPPIYGRAEAPGAGEGLNWEQLIGLNFPIKRPVFIKLLSVEDLLIFSIVAAFVHLLIGFALGVVNEWGHSRRHAIAKIAWILVLFGLFTLILVRAWDPALDPGQEKLANDILSVPPMSLFPRTPGLSEIPGFSLGSLGFGPGKPVPYATLGLLLGGAGILAVTETPLAVVEIIGLLANMISYGRLAGIAVAKAAMAEAFNVPLFGALHQGPLAAAGAVAGLVVAHLIILFLGAISSGIQAIRLHYVEQFLKFFKGGGEPFRPFGARGTAAEA